MGNEYIVFAGFSNIPAMRIPLNINVYAKDHNFADGNEVLPTYVNPRNNFSDLINNDFYHFDKYELRYLYHLICGTGSHSRFLLRLAKRNTFTVSYVKRMLS